MSKNYPLKVSQGIYSSLWDLFEGAITFKFRKNSNAPKSHSTYWKYWHFLPVSVHKALEGYPDRIAGLSDPDCVEHAGVPQLGQHTRHVELHGGLVRVRFDASHEPGIAARHGVEELVETVWESGGEKSYKLGTKPWWASDVTWPELLAFLVDFQQWCGVDRLRQPWANYGTNHSSKSAKDLRLLLTASLLESSSMAATPLANV